MESMAFATMAGSSAMGIIPTFLADDAWAKCHGDPGEGNQPMKANPPPMAKDSVELSESERRQKAHYDSLSDSYNSSYSDPWSIRYRDDFFHASLFDGVDLSGKKVLDAMCGYGDMTSYLLSRGAVVQGLDISESQVRAYTERWGCEGICASMLSSGLPSEEFDVIAICGALHHLHPHIDAGMEEIHRLLKPGGVLCFVEPHSHSILEWPRKLWYSLDPLFEENEDSVNVDKLEATFAEHFNPRRIRYGGGLAYLLVLNSMVFRIPHQWKPYYSSFLLWLESITNKLTVRPFSLYVTAQWTKNR
jgi:SAM-dependent methyltransferase